RRVGRVGEIDRDPMLRPVDRMETGRGALLERRAPAARRVAALRVLDLDDLGAELAEDHPGIGRGDRVADLDDDNSGQRTDGRHGSPRRHRETTERRGPAGMPARGRRSRYRAFVLFVSSWCVTFPPRFIDRAKRPLLEGNGP